MKQLLVKFSDYYFIILAFLAGYTPPFYMSPFFAGMIAILILQLVFKYRILGILLGTLFVFTNLYMLGALLSEFNEFPVFNHEAKKLLFVGLILCILTMIAAVCMIYKYSKMKSQKKLIKI